VRRLVTAVGAAASLAAVVTTAAGARPLLLPSPTLPLDTKVPLRSAKPPAQLQVPLNARVESRERVLVDVLRDGRVVGLRVVQRLTVTGTGDYFLSVPAPVLDVRAAPGSDAEPGFRRTGILWQGFANQRRVLAADAKLDPARAASALPLRVELAATVDGRALAGSQRRSGRLRLELTLRNATAVRAPLASGRPARPGELRRVMARTVSELRRGEIPEQPVVEVKGPIRSRTVVVDAPLVVSGEVRLPVRRLSAPVVHGGSLVRRGREVAVRFRFVLARPERATTTVALAGSVAGASAPDASVVAEPSAVTAVAAAAGPASTTAAAGTLLLRLARVRQYDAFLANPAPGGSVEAVYRFRTTNARARPSAAAASSEDEDGILLPVVLVLGTVVATGGLVVLWAHL
jgi:hypothetical protein